MHPPPNAQQQREELQRKEEARREEQERANLESQLQSFDAHEFYEMLESWATVPIPPPIRQTVHVTPLRQKIVLQQPLPLSRKELSDLRKISSHSAKLLYLLRSINQRGMECPYIHQLHKSSLERAIEKCDRLTSAGRDYNKRSGVWARFAQLFNKAHLDSMKKDLDFFKGRLESILMLCRHEEFAQDLMNIRRAVTYRTGMLLHPKDSKDSQAQMREHQMGAIAGLTSPKGIPRAQPTPPGRKDPSR